MIEFVLSFFGNYLIEFMISLLTVALVLRWFSFTHSKRDEIYFSHFTRELNATIDHDKIKGHEKSEDEEIGDYLTNILGRVNKKLPQNNIREDLSRKGSNKAVTLKSYVGDRHGLISSIQAEESVFNSPVSPDFSQLTDRIMNDDENWSKLFGIIPVDGATRILDVLPSMFIVLGVFGTFIGINMALPEIAKIDFNNLEASGQSLSDFVINVTFAMKTSIAGIFFSIILTLLNTVWPIEATRERTFEKVENCLQVLWYHLHSDENKSDAEKYMPAMLKTLEKILHKLGGDEKLEGKVEENEKLHKKAS